MGKQEFNTDFAEMLMGLMSSGLKAMVQRLYEMLMSMEVDNKLKERTEMRGQKVARGTAAGALEACLPRLQADRLCMEDCRLGQAALRV